MVSGSTSSKELKNAIKSWDLPLLRALEAKFSFKVREESPDQISEVGKKLGVPWFWDLESQTKPPVENCFWLISRARLLHFSNRCLHWNRVIKTVVLTTIKATNRSKILSKPQLNHNSTQPNITLSWVRHENDFAHHPTRPPQKLNVSNISAVTDPILMKL